MVSLGSETPLSQLSMGSFMNGEMIDAFPQDQNNTFNGPPAMSDITGTSYMGGLMMNVSASDMHSLQSDNKLQNIRIQDLQLELAAEQENVAILRKKLNSSERERLDRITTNNDEISRLDGDTMRLRSDLEKAEAIRQALEFDVIKLQRKLEQEQRLGNDREALLSGSNLKFKNTIAELNKKVSQLQQEIQKVKNSSKQEVSLINLALDEKEQLIAIQRTERDSIESDKDRFHAVVTQQEKTISTMNERIRELEMHHRSDADSLKQNITENSLLLEREKRLKTDLDIALDKIKSLESGVEAERAAHLESKFNSEILQLRLKELETTVESEKTVKNDALTATGKLQEQLRDIQNAYEEELKSSQVNREKLEQDLIFKCVLPATRAEKEYALLSKQLQSELDDKKSIINQLSKQLEIHQKNFDELKEELNNTKKRQLVLEGTYEGSMKELELLTQGFVLDQPPTVKKKGFKKTTTKIAKSSDLTCTDNLNGTLNPSALLDTLRKTLVAYRKQLEDTSKELISVRTLYEKTAVEADHLKANISKKDKALENTQLCATRSTKDVKRMKGETLSLSEQLKETKLQLDIAQKALQEERLQHNQVNHQMIQLASKYASDEKTHTELLHSLYRQLVTGLQTLPSHDEQLATFNTTELGILITEQLSMLTNASQRAEEKIKLMEGLLKTRDDGYGQLQRLHEEQLNKLSAATHGQTQTWQQQKQQIEEHYSQLLTEIHSRHKKTQSLADQAWEKVRASGTLQQGLEDECMSLRKQINVYQSENSSLLAACALLCGAIYPLFSRFNALSAQRQLLGEKLISAELFRGQIQLVLQALVIDPHRSTQEVDCLRKKRAPLLIFRSGAIAVLAANRLIQFCRSKAAMFVTHDAVPGVYSSIVCCGGVADKSLTFTGVATTLPDDRMPKISDDQVLEWLSSRKLSTMLCNSMVELNNTMLSCEDMSSSTMSVIGAARNSFQKLLAYLPAEFNTVQVNSLHAGFCERGSLVWRLHKGLLQALQHPSTVGRNVPLCSQDVLNGLQKSIMEFTQHLHTTEVERRDLRQEINRMKKSKQNSISHLKQECHALKSQTDDMIPRDQHGDVCQELEEALKREQHAQELLQEQTQRINDLSQQIETQMCASDDKEQTLADAVTGLNAAKKELQYQEQQVRQLGRQREHLEREKNSIQEKVRDAENALRTAAKDREVLSSFMGNVGNALEKMQGQWSVVMSRGPVDLSPLTSSELLPLQGSTKSGRIGAELAACQNLVKHFVDTQRLFNGRLSGLQQEIDQHKQHIRQLKSELSDACQRQITDGFDANIDDLADQMQNYEAVQDIHAEQTVGGFAPLLEDTTESVNNSPMKSAVVKQSNNTQGTTHGTTHGITHGKHKSSYKTPTLSTRVSNIRSKYEA